MTRFLRLETLPNNRKGVKTMKRLSFVIIILIPFWLFARQDSTLLLKGEIYSNHRLLFKDKNDWAWNENRLDLSLQKRSGKFNIFSNIWLNHLNAPQIETSRQLYGKDHITPLNLEIREAYAEVKGFVYDNVDLKIGRQRFAWGTADKFNPTDNLNPPDLEDILDFGRKRGIEGLNLNWYFDHAFSLQAIYIPFFRPANLPVGIFSEILANPVKIPSNLVVDHYSDRLLMPRNNFSEGATAGIRLKGFVMNTDFSLSYVYGRDALPQPVKATFGVSDQGITLNTELLYPRQHIIGADLAGNIGKTGVWAEAALSFPVKELILTTDLSALFPQLSYPLTFDSVVLEKKPYTKFVIGGDYTFRNGIYLNLQYLHGFIHERGKGNLDDYILAGIEKSFWNDKLVVRPLAGGLVVSDWQKPTENYALFYTPEITWKGIDNFEVCLGAFIFEGKGDNLFAGLKNYNMVAVKAKVSF